MNAPFPNRTTNARLAALLAFAVVLSTTAAAPTVARASGTAPPSAAVARALSVPIAPPPLATERIYFAVTDRYANGDPTNDRAGTAGNRYANGFDPTDPAWFHGGDLVGLRGGCTDPQTGLQRIKNLGFTGLWLTPPFGQRWVQGESAAYHGYWITDFTTVDRHLGTEADFAALVTCAHSIGMRVYLDIVVNHTADVTTLSPGGSFVEPSTSPYHACDGSTFDLSVYTSWAVFPCLNASSFPYVATIPTGMTRAPSWLNDVTVYHNRGDISWGACSDTCYEQGDFFGLDDLFTEQPRVVNGLAAVYASWITRFHVDGFRIDTAKHVDRAFFGRFMPQIIVAAKAAGIKSFQAFGEDYEKDENVLAQFSRTRGLPNVLDFPLQDAMTHLAGSATGALAVADRLESDDLFQNPSGTPYVPVTFLGNHDMGRAALMVAAQSSSRGATLAARVLLATDMLLLLRGTPVVMYGDEFGLMGSGGDAAARQDLFATHVSAWQNEERVDAPAIGSGSSFADTRNPIGLRIARLNALRASYPVFAVGTTIVRYARKGVIVLSRIDSASHREYLEAFNAGSSPAMVQVASVTPSSNWSSLLGGSSARSTAAGVVSLRIPAIGSVVLRSARHLSGKAPKRVAIAVAEDTFNPLYVATATVAGTDPGTVTFAVKHATGTWTRLATDPSSPYRGYLDPARFARNERVSLVAIFRSTAGTIRVSRVVGLTVRPLG